MKNILVHICCAHCAAYTVEHWREQGFVICGYSYNPNIHPFTEHQNRLEAVKTLARVRHFPVIFEKGYEMPEYFRRVAGNEADRCRRCFEMRLVKTAHHAAANGFDAFTTSLLISPHQKHDTLREVGEKVASKVGIEFLYADLRKRYSDSRRITKPLDLYRQQYCGCIYSETERYSGDSCL